VEGRGERRAEEPEKKTVKNVSAKSKARESDAALSCVLHMGGKPVEVFSRIKISQFQILQRGRIWNREDTSPMGRLFAGYKCNLQCSTAGFPKREERKEEKRGKLAA
jgi:hypothetical protein